MTLQQIKIIVAYSLGQNSTPTQDKTKELEVRCSRLEHDLYMEKRKCKDLERRLQLEKNRNGDLLRDISELKKENSSLRCQLP
ncbi:hypothetical protein EB796_016801 [Bugula neritina]|uniref:Uncharacterized protein n=1 Tax=Bugula neritina TaxID=10212 RepID=A0A7J7JH13_BUGNE|nr:hypothetical protein EB796_016801 [Bugula neritina]